MCMTDPLLGRTALCLSGGATFGFYHFGVVRCLIKNNVLPTVISGTSAGSTVAALLCTHTDTELAAIFDSPATLHALCQPFEDLTFVQSIQRFLQRGYLMDEAESMRKLRVFCKGDMTFQEAFERTGRVLNIAVMPSPSASMARTWPGPDGPPPPAGRSASRGRPTAPFSGHPARPSGDDGTPMSTIDAPPQLLNHLNAPNVVIRSAVLASSALPGVVAPITLLHKRTRRAHGASPGSLAAGEEEGWSSNTAYDDDLSPITSQPLSRDGSWLRSTPPCQGYASSTGSSPLRSHPMVNEPTRMERLVDGVRRSLGYVIGMPDTEKTTEAPDDPTRIHFFTDDKAVVDEEEMVDEEEIGYDESTVEEKRFVTEDAPLTENKHKPDPPHYHVETAATGQQWRDGSMQADIPLEKLFQHFHITSSIVSQVNPVVSLFAYESTGSAGQPSLHRKGTGWRGGFISSLLELYFRLDLHRWLRFLGGMSLLPTWFHMDWSMTILQRWHGKRACIDLIHPSMPLHLILTLIQP